MKASVHFDIHDDYGYDQVTLFSVTEMDNETLASLINEFETIGFGKRDDGTMRHVSLKLTRRTKEAAKAGE